MGFFKGLVNFVSGGGAEVGLEAGDAVRGQAMPVKVTATIADSDVEVRKVYVRLRATEEIDIPDVTVMDESGRDKGKTRRGLERREQTHDQEIQVAGPQTLKAGESYTFEAEVPVPLGVPPSFAGRYCRHEWRITAGLDKPGNDPDSGWTLLEVR